VAEELRFFFRVALFTIVIATIYWLVSYEEAGTWLLAGIVASAAFFVGVVGLNVRGSRRGGRSVKALLGFADSGPDNPLLLEEDSFPLSSAWPVIVSVAAALVGVGLIYGAWLWIPGAAVGLAGAWGWLTETG
jgi:hypothetical protein